MSDHPVHVFVVDAKNLENLIARQPFRPFGLGVAYPNRPIDAFACLPNWEFYVAFSNRNKVECTVHCEVRLPINDR
jgi:hypothetical protein